jgi:hypothetical protein
MVVLFSACDDKEEVVLNASLEETNKPPLIVAKGPEFSGGEVAVVGRTAFESFWVLVADPNGLDDVSAVFLEIGGIHLNAVVCRRDSSTAPPNECDHGPSYKTNDILDISSAFPASFPAVEYIEMHRRGQGGIFEAPGLWPQGGNYYDYGYTSPVLIDLQGASSTFTQSSLCVDYYYDDSFYQFRVLPPTLPEATEVFITLVEATLTGMSITVYDGRGASTKVTIPDLRITWMTSAEESGG